MTAVDGTLILDTQAQELLFRSARTANTFTDEPVTDEQLQEIYELVKWAPTSMNIQPMRIVALRSEEARQRLLPHLAEGNRAKTEAAPLTVLLAADTEFHENLPVVFPHRPEAKDLYVGNDEFREHTARLNATLQIGYFILGVRAAGLAVGPMTGFNPDGIDAEFFPDGRQRTLVAMNIGKPGKDAWFDRLPRLDYDQVSTTL